MTVNSLKAIELLKGGKVIGIPTDTVYGFACLSEFAEEIYTLKKRDKNKKLISFVKRDYYFDVDTYTQDVFEKYWPGNYTFIIPQNNELVSYRIPNEPNVLELLQLLDKRLLTTSANISGEEPVTTKEEFEQRFPNIPLLKEEIESKKTKTPSKIYIIKEEKMIEVR